MTFQIRKAERKAVKMRLGLSGASGFGKTFSALLLASGLTDWSKIVVIDTENGSASLYSHLGDFNTIELTAPYTPERYIEAITACERAGMEVIILDSISHEWEGKGGCLQLVESFGGRYQDWAKVTPRHQAFIDKLLTSPCHIITTVRRKQDYEMTKDDKGKIQVQKAGTKEITRDGFEYELTLSLELINDKHLAKASKDRTGLFMDKPEFIVSAATGKMILDWCNSGKAVEPLDYETLALQLKNADTLDSLQILWGNYADHKEDAKMKGMFGTRRKEIEAKPVTATAE